MKLKFDEMSTKELRAYILAHRQDMEPLRVLYSRRSPDSEATGRHLVSRTFYPGNN